MADVRPDRAQLVLVAGLVLAATFIGLALVVNTVVFTENLATRQSVDTGDTVKYRQAVRAHAKEALHSANYMSNDSSYAARSENYTESTEAWEVSSARYEVTSGHMSNLSTDGRTKGTRVIQDNNRMFEPANPDQTLLGLNPLGLLDNERWLVANDSQIRDFRMHVDHSSLELSNQNLIANILDQLLFGGDGVFWTQIEADEGTWKMAVYEDEVSHDLSVTIARPDGGISTCTVAPDSDGMVWINVSEGTLNGDGGPQDCADLAFLDEIDGSYDVFYVNGESIKGTYQFIADKEEETFRKDVRDQNAGTLLSLIEGLLGSLNPDDIEETDTYYEEYEDGDPYTTKAIYDSSAEITYETNGIAYRTTVQVPTKVTASPPQTGQAPEVNLESVSVDGTLNIDWSVTDPDSPPGDVEVTATLVGYSSGNSTIIDTATGGGSATLTTSAEYGGYRVAIVAVDVEGNRDCLRATDTSDDLDGTDDISEFEAC